MTPSPVAPSGRSDYATVEFPAASWTSFDRYARYGAIVRTIRANLGPATIRVLDVGDSAGYLGVFDAGLDTTGVDLAVSDAPLPGARRVIGDGLGLPFPDRSFDAVVSSDALEHVPPARREGFISEMARVARELVVLAAPFDTPGVSGAEEVVRRFAMLATGSPQEQLDEHREHGLPGLLPAVVVFTGCGLHVSTAGNGNLHDWVSMMLVKHQLLGRPALMPLEAGYDLAYNLLFSSRQDDPPFYRHVIVGRRSADPVTPAQVSPIAGTPEDLAATFAVWAAANVAEASRQDTVPRLDGLQMQIAGLERQQQVFDERMALMEERLAAAAADLSQLNHHVGQLWRLVRLAKHPVRTVVRRAWVQEGGPPAPDQSHHSDRSD